MTSPSHHTPHADTQGPALLRRGPVRNNKICLTEVLGDLGAWLEETERHRRAVTQPRKVA